MQITFKNSKSLKKILQKNNIIPKDVNTLKHYFQKKKTIVDLESWKLE